MSIVAKGEMTSTTTGLRVGLKLCICVYYLHKRDAAKQITQPRSLKWSTTHKDVYLFPHLLHTTDTPQSCNGIPIFDCFSEREPNKTSSSSRACVRLVLSQPSDYFECTSAAFALSNGTWIADFVASGVC